MIIAILIMTFLFSIPVFAEEDVRPSGDPLIVNSPAEQPSKRTRRFSAPKVKGYGVDNCLNWATLCGKPAADEFCRRQGYTTAVNFKIKKDMPPTLVLGDNTVCGNPFCDRFDYVICMR